MPTHDTALIPRKTPRQARAQATCVAIRQAAAHILTGQGRGALTTNRIAERAGVSIGSLYQYYPSKEAILAEMIREMRQDMWLDIRDAAERSDNADLRDLAEALVRASVGHHAKAPELARQLEQMELDLPPDPETHQIERSLQALLVRLLADRGVAAPETAAQDLTAMTKGVAAEAARVGETDMDPVIARICRAVWGYLGV